MFALLRQRTGMLFRPMRSATYRTGGAVGGSARAAAATTHAGARTTDGLYARPGSFRMAQPGVAHGSTCGHTSPTVPMPAHASQR